jgi:glycosyltransferase involved in cell wall biosynthesis
MTVCYFGFYHKGYSRNCILIKGLQLEGVKVIKCHTEKLGALKYFDLIRKFFHVEDFDIMVVGYPGFQALILAKLLTRKMIVFDAFLSLYDSNVSDRKAYSQYSLKACRDWLLDYFSSHLADKVALDTNEHIEYFVNKYHVKRKKFFRIFVGSDDKYFFPVKKISSDKFIVHFHGMGTPLQGAEYIIKAAELLKNENIYFNIVGSRIKNTYNYSALKKISFIDNIPYEQINNYLALADISLGIFGNVPKTKRVIPNKIFESLAARIPVITAETPAVKELLEDNKNVILCRTADANDLAKKIMMLKNDQALRERIADNGYNLFISKLTPHHLGHELFNAINLETCQ